VLILGYRKIERHDLHKAFLLHVGVWLMIRIKAGAQGSESCTGLFKRDCISALSSERIFALMTFMLITENFQSNPDVCK
jgi:hypothetical protein